MRLLITVTVCVLAFGLASCAEPSGEYLPPVEISQEYIPPVEAAPAATLADDGYRYKAVKRLKFRHRRDVSNEYLPPVEESDVLTYNEALGPVPADAAPAHSLSADGYRYKAVKRHRYRHRRDVSEINNEYLPPVQGEHVQSFEQAAPAEFVEPAPAHTLADDGYRYKAVKRYRFRHRRDVSNEYLPPVQEQTFEQAAPAPIDIAEPEPAHTLADDGYRYKAVKRYRYRHRRDVSNEYLPPVQEQQVQTFEQAAPAEFVEPAPAHTLADDGYRYKAVKRLKYRHRRDVSELNNEYLPPVQGQQVFEQAAPAPIQIAEPEPAHTLADDGYRYKAVKRVKYRHRRDVSELNNEYLPPVQGQQVFEQAAPAPIQIAEPEPAHTLADDGYRYKAVKRLRYRHRRDVSELNNEYLPPVQGEAAPAEFVEPAPAHTLADDGYRYKAVKRLRYRHRRDVSELNNEYLPPVQGEAAPAEFVEPAPAHTLADDGYRYKAVKRYRLRHRRDVSELNNEYLPPVQGEVAPAEFVEPAPAHTLADDGYRYKAVKRYRLRHRRDVSELSNEYLPPTQEVSQEYLPPVTQQVGEAAPAHSFGDDGYKYKAIRRKVFRRKY